MNQFLAFSLYLTFGVTFLVIWPIMAHPSLPQKRKLVLCIGLFLLLVPGGLVLYSWLGVPQLAAQ